MASLKQADGRQVTYNGHFLYTFVDDSPGHVTGQGVSDFFVATPNMRAIGSTTTVKAAPAPVAPSQRIWLLITPTSPSRTGEARSERAEALSAATSRRCRSPSAGRRR